MPALTEAQQVGLRQSIADLIAIIETEGCPMTSMMEKREKPKQVKHDWQVKSYQVTGHRGVLDLKDADKFSSNPRQLISMYAQKTWFNPAISDFADEAEVAGLNKGEMAGQVADALVNVKRQIEKRVLSNVDTSVDNGTTKGYETRGDLSYISNTAQATFPIPDGFRTPVAQIYSGTLANFTEELFITMTNSSYVQRKGPVKMDAFLGIYLKSKISSFSKYVDNIANKTPVRRFNMDEESKVLINVIDKLVMDSGEIDLHAVPFLATDADTGADSAATHNSGIVVDMDMKGLAYTRLPRVFPLPPKGGGPRAIVDAIFINMFDNVLGAMAMNING